MRRAGISFIMASVLLTGMVILVGGCASFTTERGVENRWRAADAPVFEPGSTTESDVLRALGPPSQVISLGDRSVFYYLLEQGTGKALILLVYNDVRANVKYDRAIFFFDARGILTDYSYSKREPPPSESTETP